MKLVKIVIYSKFIKASATLQFERHMLLLNKKYFSESFYALNLVNFTV